jgi:hypothetical protein
MQTRAKIDMKAGIIELEGSEDFVKLNIDKFTAFFQLDTPNPQRSDVDKILPEKTINTAPSNTNKRSKATITTKAPRAPAKSRSIESTRFDIHKNESSISLQEFLEEKMPKSTGDYIAVIGYYITQTKNATSFSEGNIDYAYRTLKIKGRPKHLRQIIINNKNAKDLFEESKEDDAWVLTRAGEIYVEENLPPKVNK